jgi:hypothetical protein
MCSEPEQRRDRAAGLGLVGGLQATRARALPKKFQRNDVCELLLHVFDRQLRADDDCLSHAVQLQLTRFG